MRRATRRLIEKRITYPGESDADGTPKPDEVWRYAWNGAGLLAQVTRPDGVRVKFAYDPFARRMGKGVVVGTQPTELRPSSTRFVWDGNLVAHEVRHATNETNDPIVEERVYLFAGMLSPRGHGTRDGGSESMSWFHYCVDASGAPANLVDDKGQPRAAYRRGAWGTVELLPGAVATTSVRAPGQYEDDDIGLRYNRFRYCDEDSRFISADPVRLRGGANAYVLGPNAISWVDPIGLVKKSAIPDSVWGRMEGLPSGPGVYVLEADGKKYVGSGAGEGGVKGRLCEQEHPTAEGLLKDEDVKITVYPVELDQDDPGHSMKVAEQMVMDTEQVEYDYVNGPNKIPALKPKKLGADPRLQRDQAACLATAS